jgi:TRAP-type C4-dicarboxylate transport system substrate-binding protein
MGKYSKIGKASLVFALSAWVVSSLGLGVKPAIAADAPIKIKVLSSWGTDQTYTKMFLVPWVEKVNQRSGGKVQVSWVGPEAVPPFSQLQPLTMGLFDVLYTHSAYHAGEVAIGVSMDLVKGKMSDKRAAGFLEILDQGYQKVNAKVLGLNVLGVGYTVMLKNKIEKADFSGLKLRTTPSYEPLVKALNGASVRLANAENYSALEKGVVDGVCNTAFTSVDLRFYEVAKYFMKPLYGEVTQHFLVNLDSWSKWPKDVQDLVTDVTKEMEEEARVNLAKYFDERVAELTASGKMVINELPEAEGRKFQQTYYDRSWEEFVLKLEPELGPKMKAIADKFVQDHPQD